MGLSSYGKALTTGVAIRSMCCLSSYASLSFRLRRRQKQASRASRTRPAKAPSTPPAMAPAELESDSSWSSCPPAGTVVPLEDSGAEEVVVIVRVMAPTEVEVLVAVPVVVGAGGSAFESVVELTTI